MTEEEIIKIAEDFVNHIRFNEKAKYSISQWYMAVEDLSDLYKKEKEKNIKLQKRNDRQFKMLRELDKNTKER